MTPSSSSMACRFPDHAMPHVRVSVWALLVATLTIVFMLELSLGSVLIPFPSVISILLGYGDAPEGWRQIVLLLRLPRALTAMLAGAALGMAGLKMQTLFRNPLADPFVLGISSGASLGVAVMVLAFWGAGWPGLLKKAGIMGDLSLVLSATLGALAVLAVVLGAARRVESNLTILIIGIMFGYMSGALVSILIQFTHEQQVQLYLSWTFGSFGAVTWRQMPLFTLALTIGLTMGCILSKSLNGLLLGEGYAKSMGINVRRLRCWIIFGGGLLAGTVTAYCGPIGFLGIAIPHLCRLLMRTSDHHVLTPAVILLGAILALAADLLSQVPGTKIVLPLNAVTALMGAPVVVAAILRRRQAVEVTG